MAAPIQAHYKRYEQAGWPGDLAKPNAPYEFIMGEVGSTLTAGQGVQYNESTNKFESLAVAATKLNAALVTEVEKQIGIVSFDSGSVAATRSVPGSGSNSDAYVEYESGDYAKIAIMGTFWGIANETINFGDVVVFDADPGVEAWRPVTVADTDLPRNPAICVSHGVASGDLFEIRLAGPTR